MKNELKYILFDFDGVLSNGRFYSTISESHPDIYSKIYKRLFTNESWEFIKVWMNGGMTYKEMHGILADEVGVTVEFLNKSLIDSVLLMKMNEELLLFAKEIRSKGVITSIFTDNMDIFEQIFVPHNDLESKFDYVFSSFSCKKLKMDNNAKFLKDVLSELNASAENVLFIDDSPEIGIFMEKLGGHFYLYHDYKDGFEEFRSFIEKNFDY